MRNNIRNLIVIAVVAAVLGGALLTLKLTGNNTTASSSASSAASIELVSKKSEDVVSMNVVNQKGSYTLVPVSKAPSAASSAASSQASSDGTGSVTYTVRELSGCPINTSETESVVKNGFSLVASKNLGTVSSLDEFGLQNPQATVRVSFKDGSSYDYKIGKVSATDSTAYYMCGLNSDNVYIVSIDDGLLEGPDYFISKDILAITSSSGDNDFARIILSGSAYPKPVTLSLSENDLKITAPAEYSVDATALSDLKTNLSTLTADSVAAVNPDAAALKKYGLDHPAAAADFTVNGKRYTLNVGSKDGGDRYVMLGGVNVVYSAAATSLSWSDKGLFGLRDKKILSPDMESVKSVTVVSGGKTDELNVARTKDASKSTQDKTYYTYKLTGNGGKSLDYEKNYLNYFSAITGVTVLQDAQEKPSGAPDLTLTYRYFDKSGADTVEFYKSGDRRYTAVLNGSVFGVVTQDDLDTLTNETALMESGKAVS